ARSRRAERWIVGIADGSTDRADAEVAEREFIEVGLAENHGAALLHAGGNARIDARVMIDERERSAGGWQFGGVNVVLEDDWDAVEWTTHASGGALRIAGAGVGDRARIDGEHRPEGRAMAIVERQSRKVLAHDVLGRHAAGGHRGLKLRDRLLED